MSIPGLSSRPAPVKDELYVWRADQATRPVFVKVLRVSRIGEWADLLCGVGGQPGGHWWTKRQSLPLPDTFQRTRWTTTDVEASS